MSIAFIFVFLCSCKGANERISPVLTGISFTARISYCDQSYTCSVTAEKNGVYEVRFDASETLEEQTVTFETSKVITEFAGLRHEQKNGVLNDSPVGLTVSVLRDAAASQRQAVFQNGEFLMKGKVSRMPYTVRFGASGLPISLKIPDRELYVEFQNGRIL